MRFSVFLAIFACQVCVCISDNVDPDRAITWGPGLQPSKIVLPARYFFVQLVDHAGKK